MYKKCLNPPQFIKDNHGDIKGTKVHRVCDELRQSETIHFIALLFKQNMALVRHKPIQLFLI